MTVAQAFDARDAVAGFSDNADVAFARRGFKTGDLRFDFFEDTAHRLRYWLELLLETMQPVAHAAVPNVVPDTNAHSAEQVSVHDKPEREITAVLAFQVRDDFFADPGASAVAVSIVAVRFSTSRRNRRL